MEKIQIRDKHTGSATLVATVLQIILSMFFNKLQESISMFADGSGSDDQSSDQLTAPSSLTKSTR